MPRDDYGAQADTITSSSLAPFAITPDDSNDLTRIPKGLWVGGAGDVTLRGVNGSNVTFAGVQAGSILPVRPSRILSTGTTATGIIGL